MCVVMTSEKYVEGKGLHCPYCHADAGSFDGAEVEVDAGKAYQDVVCLECGREWRDTYVLTGFTEV